MKLSAQLTVATELDVDALVKGEANEIQRLLDACAFQWCVFFHV